MSKEHDPVDTVDGILQQIVKTREELSRLTDLQQDPGITLRAISVECYLINKSITTLREQLLLSLSWSECRTAENQWFIDALLFAISATLCSTLSQLDFYRNQRPARSSFRFLSRETPKVKVGDLETSLGRLREQSSMVQCILSMFDTTTDETGQMISHCRFMLEKMENDWISSTRSNANVHRPSYVAHLLTPRSHSKELLSPYRLTRELQIEGMSMEHILDLYGKSNVKPFMIRDILRRWHAYTDERDYKIMLTTLAHNSFDIMHVDMHLTRLYELSPIAFSNALGILSLNDYNIARTYTGLLKLWNLLFHEPEWTPYGGAPCREELLHHKAYSKVLKYFHGRPNGLAKACSNLTNLRNLLCFEPEWARKYNVVRYLSLNLDLPSIPIGNLDFILEAIDIFDGDVFQVHSNFHSLLESAGLTQLSMDERSRKYPGTEPTLTMSPKEILDASNMALELWRSNGFDTSISRLAFEDGPVFDLVISNVLVYLHALRRSSYRQDVVRTLKSISVLFPINSPAERSMSHVLWVAAYCPNSHNSLVSQLYNMIRLLASYFREITKSEYLSLPHWELMRQYGYNLARIGDVRQTLEASFPAALVKEGYHWIWFTFNNFDIEVTKTDATLMPTTFLGWGREERILEIKRMHRARGLNITYEW
ncbi:hypothetical protein PIIN_07211 [Serendipita indica DSM 11827]|uniref:Uncharacterized protein n=1 Tax=Serendipita indica (strain DSM 11827) TaxID=1109443 RepID=G4TPL1_SERID|nr:hypothetical protein PIIN_07211 [Serendipita indica DSM 11827]